MPLKYQELFKPFRIGNVEVKNRVIMSAMHNIGWKDSNDIITDNVIDYFEARAKGGVGLIFGGSTEPDYQLHNGGKFISAFHDPMAFIFQFKKLADRLHAYGCKFFVQLGWGNGGHNLFGYNGDPVAASDLECRWDTSIKCRALTIDEIKEIVEASINAAVISKQAGADGINLCCYGGYLMDEFLISTFNKRTDEYGGSLDGRVKIVVDMIKGIKERCGKDFPVTVRMGTKSYMKGLRQGIIEGEEYDEFGRDIDESIEIAKKFEESGCDALFIGNGTYDSFYWLYPPMYQKEGLWLDDIEKLTKSVSIPVMAGGRVLQPLVANDAIKCGKVDAIVLGRALLADSDWVNKAKRGDDESIRPCIGCNFGCIGHIFSGLPHQCAVNADLYYEKNSEIIPAVVSKKVAIIGGGVAGMECARVAAKRGHRVTLFEKSDKLGGTFLAASVGKDAEIRLLAWFERELKLAGVTVELNSAVTAESIGSLDFDEIVVASGNKPKMPPILGLDGENVVTVVDALTEKKEVCGDNIVVIGGGLAGCEAAIWLSEDKKKNVTVIEAARELMGGGIEPMPLPNKLMIIDKLAYDGVDVKLNAIVKCIADGKVFISDTAGEHAIAADTVVLAIGFNPNNELYKEIDANVAKPVWCLGDAKTPSNIMFGIRDADAIAKVL